MQTKKHLKLKKARKHKMAVRAGKWVSQEDNKRKKKENTGDELYN